MHLLVKPWPCYFSLHVQISLLSTFALALLMTGHMIQMRINQPTKDETEAEKGEHLAIEALQSVRAVARNAFEEQLLGEYEFTFHFNDR